MNVHLALNFSPIMTFPMPVLPAFPGSPSTVFSMSLLALSTIPSAHSASPNLNSKLLHPIHIKAKPNLTPQTASLDARCSATASAAIWCVPVSWGLVFQSSKPFKLANVMLSVGDRMVTVISFFLLWEKLQVPEDRNPAVFYD